MPSQRWAAPDLGRLARRAGSFRCQIGSMDWRSAVPAGAVGIRGGAEWISAFRFRRPPLARTFEALPNADSQEITTDVHLKATPRIPRLQRSGRPGDSAGSVHWLQSLPDRARCRSSPSRSVGRSVAAAGVAWFGVGEFTRIFLIAYGCFWIILTNAVEAVKGPGSIFSPRSRWALRRRRSSSASCCRPACRAFSPDARGAGMAFLVIIAARWSARPAGRVMEAATSTARMSRWSACYSSPSSALLAHICCSSVSCSRGYPTWRKSSDERAAAVPAQPDRLLGGRDHRAAGLQ